MQGPVKGQAFQGGGLAVGQGRAAPAAHQAAGGVQEDQFGGQAAGEDGLVARGAVASGRAQGVPAPGQEGVQEGGGGTAGEAGQAGQGGQVGGGGGGGGGRGRGLKKVVGGVGREEVFFFFFSKRREFALSLSLPSFLPSRPPRAPARPPPAGTLTAGPSRQWA
jgi:hypothetical protein